MADASKAEAPLRALEAHGVKPKREIRKYLEEPV
jgi:hypothetical protein